MVALLALLFPVVALHGAIHLPKSHQTSGTQALGYLVLSAASGAVLTTDLFNLFVWFELLLIGSVGLLVIGGDRSALEGGLKFLALNWLNSLLLLITCGLVYAEYGTLNMADLSTKVGGPLNALLSALLAASFLTKAAAFPVFQWLPAAYGPGKGTVVAFLAAISTKLGVYALLRTDSIGFGLRPETLHILAALTMVIGVFGALAQKELQRTLSFHIVSQIGYMLFGIATGGAGLGAAFLHLAHNAIVKTGLILWSDTASSIRGNSEFSSLAGMKRDNPALLGAWTILALALIGLPSLSGFVSKLMLLQAAIPSQDWGWWISPIVVSMLTMTCLMKIHLIMLRPNEEETPPPKVPITRWAPVATLVALAIVIGVWAAPLTRMTALISEQLSTGEPYNSSVMEAGR